MAAAYVRFSNRCQVLLVRYYNSIVTDIIVIHDSYSSSLKSFSLMAPFIYICIYMVCPMGYIIITLCDTRTRDISDTDGMMVYHIWYGVGPNIYMCGIIDQQMKLTI
jgi:hypothetical protein